MLTKEESDKMFMFCLEELRLLIEEGHCTDRLSTIKDKLELLHTNLEEEFPHTEQRVIDLIKHRLINVGLETYGALDFKTDIRDFIQEGLEEVSDALIYTAIKLLKIKDRE